MNERIKYLESLVGEDKRKELEKKHWSNFEKYCSYLGNGVYSWRGYVATNTRELFLIGIYSREGVKFKEI